MTIVERELVKVVCSCCGRVVSARALSSPVSAWCEVVPHYMPVTEFGVLPPVCKGSGDVAIIPRPPKS